MVGIDGTVVAIANPYIARDVGASLSGLQWVTNGYLLALAVLLIPAGKLGDRYGRRLMFLAGVVLFALTSLLVGLSASTGEIITFRVIQGVGGALIMPNALALLRAAFPPAKLNTAVGIYGAVTAVAVAGGPILGGVLVERINWESVFFVNVPVGLIALVLGLIVLAESRAPAGRLDLLGVAVLGAGLFLLIFGVIKGQTWGWVDAKTLAFVIVGLLVLAGFVLIELKVTDPLLPMQLFSDRSIAIGTITVLLNFFALVGVLFFISLYLQSVHGYSAIGAGVRLLPLTLTFVVSSPVSGVLTGRYGPRVPIMAGLTFVGAAMIGLTQLQSESSFSVLWPPLVGLGLGIGLVVVASTDAIVGNTPVEQAGIGGGLQAAAVQLGGVLGTSILGSILASRVGSVLVDKLTGAGVPPAAADRLLGAKETISQGVAPVPSGVPTSLADAITAGSHAAFMSGLHLASIVAAVLALGGAALAVFIPTPPSSVKEVA